MNTSWSLKEPSKGAGSLLIKNTFNSQLFSSINSVRFYDLSLLWMTLHLQIKVLIAKEFQRSTSPFWDVSVSRVFQKQIIVFNLGLCNSMYTVLCGYDFMSLNMTPVPGNCITPCKILTALPASLAIHSLGLHQAAPQRSLLQTQHVPKSWGFSAWGEAIFLIVCCPWEIWPVNANFLY